MNKPLAVGLAFLVCAFSAGRAVAAVCEASYEIEGRKATAWFDLGEVSGPQKIKNCLAKAKNDAANRKPAELGFVKVACDDVPVVVTIYTRLESKGKRETPAAAIKTSFGLKCPPPKGK